MLAADDCDNINRVDTSKAPRCVRENADGSRCHHTTYRAHTDCGRHESDTSVAHIEAINLEPDEFSTGAGSEHPGLLDKIYAEDDSNNEPEYIYAPEQEIRYRHHDDSYDKSDYRPEPKNPNRDYLPQKPSVLYRPEPISAPPVPDETLSPHTENSVALPKKEMLPGQKRQRLGRVEVAAINIENINYQRVLNEELRRSADEGQQLVASQVERWLEIGGYVLDSDNDLIKEIEFGTWSEDADGLKILTAYDELFAEGEYISSEFVAA